MTDIMTPALGESVTEATVGALDQEAGRRGQEGRGPGRARDRQGLRSRWRRRRTACWPRSPPRKARRSTPGAVLGRVSAGAGAAPAAAPAAAPKPQRRRAAPPRRAPRPRRRAAAAPPRPAAPLAPSVQRIVAENKLDPAAIAGTGKDGRITKGDALAAARSRAADASPRRPPQRRAAGAGRAPRRRRAARGAGAHDPPAPDHRPAPEGGAEHRRHADDLQRGRHERGDGAAQPLQGRCSRSATACKLGFMGFFVKACVAR